VTLRRGLLIPLALIAAASGAAGCGDDESNDTSPSVSIPSVTAPSVPTAPSAEPPSGGIAPDATTTPKDGSFDPGKPDSPENDVPPPAGSPQEAFEEMCEQNPEACG
jgi:hypothetical protein